MRTDDGTMYGDRDGEKCLYGVIDVLFIESQSATLIPIEICFPRCSRGRNNKPLTSVFLEYVLFGDLLRGRRDVG